VETFPDRAELLQTLMDIMKMQETKSPALRDKQARLLQMLRDDTLKEMPS